MSIRGLDHFTINTADLERSVGFYVGVLGLRRGVRPDFCAPGAWLYCGDRAVVHLVGDRGAATPGAGAVAHIALKCRDAAGFRARLSAAAIAFEARQVPGMALDQIFLSDPDGVRIELLFDRDGGAR